MSQSGFATNPTRSEQLLFLTDDQLRQGIELMFFAYRGFTADPDRILGARSTGGPTTVRSTSSTAGPGSP